ncbi:hypothetical protein RSC3_04184 [Bacillus paralicheniformis]|nr:hypothetical protein RSC3_04184 [Bacillus paralicheniformis]
MAERTPSIETTVTEQKRYFLSGATLAVENRLEQLNILKNAVKKYERDILEALQKDLNKSEHEAYMTEIGIVLEEIRFISRRLKKWAKPKKAKTAVSHIGSKSIVIAEPYGTVLIIAPWNYPFQLAVSPLIGALAAGNTAVIKPSELAPAVSSVISKMLKEIFPPNMYPLLRAGWRRIKCFCGKNLTISFLQAVFPWAKSSWKPQQNSSFQSHLSLAEKALHRAQGC